MNIKIRKEPVQADVLIIGGGISGMQAASRATAANSSAVPAASTSQSPIVLGGRSKYFFIVVSFLLCYTGFTAQFTESRWFS